jgi:hypothetical protein
VYTTAKVGSCTPRMAVSALLRMLLCHIPTNIRKSCIRSLGRRAGAGRLRRVDQLARALVAQGAREALLWKVFPHSR